MNFFTRKVHIERIKRGFKQTIDTLICEEATLLSMFLNVRRNNWIPRLPSLKP
jgi:hypothetical protein